VQKTFSSLLTSFCVVSAIAADGISSPAFYGAADVRACGAAIVFTDLPGRM
jgi:hypothetical protein